MKDFFNLDIANYKTISTAEKLLPILLVSLTIYCIYHYRVRIRNSSDIDRLIRFFMGFLGISFIIFYYYLEWTTFGITVDNLPLHLCFLSSISSSVLCFNKNKFIFNFVFYTGILGGISSLLFPMIDLSWQSFRYYQFMIIHSLIIIIPLYFSFVFSYIPNFLDTIKIIILLQVLAIPLGLFNEIYKTTYMFVSFNSNSAAKDSILFYIGQGPMYFFTLELLSIATIFALYSLTKITRRFKRRFTNK